MNKNVYLEIHRLYFKKLDDEIKKDTKNVVSLLIKDQWRNADKLFSHSFRELWMCFGEENEKRDFPDILDDSEHFPYSILQVDITRPKISGWLTELYVYRFIENLLDKRGFGKNYEVCGSKTKDVEKIKLEIDGRNKRYYPDVIIKDRQGRIKVAIEVKTLIERADRCKYIQELRNKLKERDIGFFLFMGEVSTRNNRDIKPCKKNIVEKLQDEDWVFLAYGNKLETIVKSMERTL